MIVIDSHILIKSPLNAQCAFNSKRLGTQHTHKTHSEQRHSFAHHIPLKFHPSHSFHAATIPTTTTATAATPPNNDSLLTMSQPRKFFQRNECETWMKVLVHDEARARARITLCALAISLQTNYRKTCLESFELIYLINYTQIT